VPGGAILIAAGAAALVPGIIAFALGDAQRDDCGPYWRPEDGPCPTTDDVKAKQIGLSLFTGGLASAVVGVAALASCADSDAFPASNVPMATSGMVLTGLGAATIVAGTVSWIALSGQGAGSEHGKDGRLAGGGVLGPIGVVALGLGLPLWIMGAHPLDSDTPEGPGPAGSLPPGQIADRNPPMIAAGIALLATALAGGGAAAALAGIASTSSGHGGGSSTEGFAAVYSTLAAGVLATAGVTLVARGLAQVPPDEVTVHKEPRERMFAATLSVGPASASVGGRF
jgi:hypothetical protein